MATVRIGAMNSNQGVDIGTEYVLTTWRDSSRSAALHWCLAPTPCGFVDISSAVPRPVDQNNRNTHTTLLNVCRWER